MKIIVKIKIKKMSKNDNQNIIHIINKKYEKKISSVSKTTAITNENNENNNNDNINRKIKRHISFKDDFLTIIDVESWKELNFDVSEIDPEWEKVESNENKNENNIINNYNKKNNNNNRHFNNGKFKEKKAYCECFVF